MPLIIIEGIIGAGKSTLAEKIHERIPRSKLYREPVNSNPYLEKFYEDPQRWALEMQYFLMAKRFKMHLEAIKEEWNHGITTIFDRSIYGDWPFAHMLYQDGLIDKLGYSSYMLHRKCMEKQLLIPQQVIYLDVSIDTAIQRIHKRGRDCERNIPREYLENLSQAYEQVVSGFETNTKVSRYKWDDGATVDDIVIEGVIEYAETSC